MKRWGLCWWSLCLCLGLTAQNITVRVVGPDGEPLAGTTIDGQPQGWTAYTDEEGEAELAYAETLHFAYPGLISHQFSWEIIKNRGGQIVMYPLSQLLPEIVVREPHFRKDYTQRRRTVNNLNIQRAQVSTPAAALEAEAGAYVQMSQVGAGSPVIRGFEANRVLLLIDDVRMNNAIYRSGHLQNAITIDENALREISVSYGPGALAFGSDALGGSVHFKTKNPLPLGVVTESRRQWGQGLLRLGTATGERTVFAELAQQGVTWSTYTAVTASRFGDLRSGSRRPAAYPAFGQRTAYVARLNDRDTILTNDQPDVQVGSGYEQMDVLQKVTWQPLRSTWRLQLNTQWSTSSGVPRYDRLTEIRNGQLRFAEWYYGPQNRALVSLRARHTPRTNWADAIRFIASWQRVDEDRFDRPYQSDWRERSLVDVSAYTLTADVEKGWDDRHILQYGLLARHDAVTAMADRVNILTNEIRTDVNSRYPSRGSQLSGTDVYTQYRYQNNDRGLLLESGLRFSQQWLLAQFGAADPIDWPGFYLTGIRNRTRALTFAQGARWQRGSWAFLSHLATGFRAPNVDDFAKFRENDGFVQIPNPDLQPEQTLTLDLGILHYLPEGGEIELVTYGTRLRNAMVRENFLLPNGNDFFVSNTDTLFVQAIVNTDRAWVAGASLSTVLPYRRWQLQGQLHYTYGRRNFVATADDTPGQVPLDHIPPLFGRLKLLYNAQRWETELVWRFQARKRLVDYAVSGLANGTLDRTGTTDNLELTPVDPITGEFAGTYGWSVWQWRAAYRFNEHFCLRAQIDNLLDLHYRNFASGVSAPGRNLVVGLNWRW